MRECTSHSRDPILCILTQIGHIRSGDLKLVSGKKFTLVGTPQGHEIKDPHGKAARTEFFRLLMYSAFAELEFLPDVINDLDVDFSANPAAAASYINDKRNRRKVQEHTKKLNINIINPLREGKRLLVLDIDYSRWRSSCPFPSLRLRAVAAILDTKPLTSGALPPQECARPGLHEFLEAVYPHYDVCIWYAHLASAIHHNPHDTLVGHKQVGSGWRRNSLS